MKWTNMFTFLSLLLLLLLSSSNYIFLFLNSIKSFYTQLSLIYLILHLVSASKFVFCLNQAVLASPYFKPAVLWLAVPHKQKVWTAGVLKTADIKNICCLWHYADTCGGKKAVWALDSCGVVTHTLIKYQRIWLKITPVLHKACVSCFISVLKYCLSVLSPLMRHQLRTSRTHTLLN